MKSYRVFSGSPQPKATSDVLPTWHTVSTLDSFIGTDLILPATLEAASTRISLLYKNIVFNDGEDTEDQDALARDDPEEDAHESQYNQTTLFTWPPTRSVELSVTRLSATNIHQETFDTQDTASYAYSDTSSIAQFPTYSFDLRELQALGSLKNFRVNSVSMLLAILEVEGPYTVSIKTGRDAGTSVSVLRMIAGDAVGQMCKVTAWRKVAEDWGGENSAQGVQRGDVTLLKNLTLGRPLASPPVLIASPFSKPAPTLTVCYRTLARSKDDRALRPDLRLAFADPVVRKVGELVEWFERMAGII